MLGLALIFFIIAGIFGFGGMAAIAEIVFNIFLVLPGISLIGHLLWRA